MKLAVLGVVAALAGTAMGGEISTGTVSNNGSGGIFMHLTPTSDPLLLTGISTQLSGTAPVAVEVWTRPGEYAGFTASNAGWTLSETLTMAPAGTLVNSPVAVLSNPIAIPAGGATSVYLHALTVGGGIRYFGTGTTSTSTYVNDDLTLFTDVSRTGTIPFGGTQFSPRAFVGVLTYDVIPAPGALALMGMGGLMAARRRR